MGEHKPFRYWFYLKTGYQMYFGFVFAAVNTLVVTYYLAIERAPFLKAIFPSFPIYALIMVAIGIPLLGFTGFIHFKRAPAFKSEQEIAVESNPFIYKLPPGHSRTVLFPHQLTVSRILLKLAKSQNILSEQEIKNMEEIQKKMETLIQGGYVGIPKGKLPFKMSESNTGKSEKLEDN